MEIGFLVFFVLAIYSYVLFPPILWLLQALLSRRWTRGQITPSVSIIISVFNEEGVIREKLENTLALDYPEGLIEIIVSSDGATDRTNEIVGEFDDPRVKLMTFGRQGKTACLNKVIPTARGEIILFTDANAMFPPDMLKKLAENFADPDVGLVTGWTKYVNPGGGREVTGLYAKLERLCKHWESLVSSCVGADGAVFAMRKSLYRPLGADDINDFIIPLNVVRQKQRAVLDPRVYCYEEAAGNEQRAYRRQVRITTRTLWAIRKNLGFLNVGKFGIFSFFLLSHKVLRLAVPFFFILSFMLCIPLLGSAWHYNVLFAGYLVFLGVGLFSLAGIARGSLSSICKFFLITFSAQFMGWLRMAAGIKDTTWQPGR